MYQALAGREDFEMPEWAKKIQPYMEALVVGQQEIGGLSSSFYPRSADCPSPNKELLRSKIATARLALGIIGEALDNLEAWTEE